MKRAAVTACPLSLAALAALAALVVATSGGCAKLREKLGKNAPPESAGAGAPAATAAPGASAGAAPAASTGMSVSTKLPDSWPKGVPAYPGSTVQSATTSATGQSLILRTRDSATRVREYYMDRLGGMKLQTDMTVPNATGPSMVMIFKDTASLVTVSIAPLPSHETSLTLAIAKR